MGLKTPTPAHSTSSTRDTSASNDGLAKKLSFDAAETPTPGKANQALRHHAELQFWANSQFFDRTGGLSKLVIFLY